MSIRPARDSSFKRDFLQNYSIGLKLRTLRQEKRLTLARLAAETGLSSALLSKLETDSMVPTLQTLASLCRVYGLGLGYFFSEPTAHSLAITRKAHLQPAGRKKQEVTRIHLHVPAARSRLVACVLDIPPGPPWAVGESGSRSELFAYVLDGHLQLTIAGAKEVFETGDSVILDTDAIALWSALGDSNCRLLTVSPR